MSGTPLELIAVEVRGDIDRLESDMRGAVQVVDRSMSSVERSVVRAERTIAASSGKAANASRNMGRQIADVGLGLSSPGVSPFLVLAQQAPQVADALSDLEGRAGRVAGFFAGPWGAALLSAVSILGLFVSGLGEEEEATKGAEKAAKSLEEAIDDLNEAQGKSIQTAQQAARAAYIHAGGMLAQEIQARKTTQALLDKAKAQLLAADDLASQPGNSEGGLNFGVAIGATIEARIAKLDALAAKQDQAIAKAGQAVRRAGIPILQQQAAEATDKAAAATGRYDRAVGKLNDRFSAGKIAPAAYQREMERLNRTRDAELEAANKSEKATKGDGDAKREAAKHARELAKAQRELEQALDQVTSRFDPARKAAAEFGQTMADIDKLLSAGKISPDDAFVYRFKAAAEQAKTIADIAAKNLKDALGYEIGGADDPIKKFADEAFKQSENRRDVERAANEAIADDFRRRQEGQIRTLAGIYEDAFRGGTGAIWEDFKSLGLRIIAETLARFTIAQLAGGGGGGIEGAFSSALGAVFGFASGGSMTIGGSGGTDTNRLSLNGRHIANVSRGETLNIGTKAMAATASGMTVVQHITVDARNSVNPDGFERRILAISGQQAQRAAATMGQGVMKAIPTRLAQFNRDGT